jgi:hypothetical protein
MKIIDDVVVLIADGVADSQGDAFLVDGVQWSIVRVGVGGFGVDQRPVGQAHLRREGNHIVAKLEILENVQVAGLYPCIGGSSEMLRTGHTNFVVESKPRLITACRIYEIALMTRPNADPRIKPLQYEARRLNSMFHVDDGYRLIKSSNGEPVPEDEPIFILRARDELALIALNVYHDELLDHGCDLERVRLHEKVIGQFTDFAIEHPDRMKQPGVTKGK